MRAARTLAEGGKEEERNAKSSRLFAISAGSRTACPSNLRRAAQCSVVIVSVPAARRIAERDKSDLHHAEHQRYVIPLTVCVNLAGHGQKMNNLPRLFQVDSGSLINRHRMIGRLQLNPGS
jgi:hypothetical protein